MKVKYLGAILFAATLTFLGCDDNTGTLGIGMLPDSDGISSHTEEFDVVTKSIFADSVFAKTSTGYVGRFTDAKFGTYEASFLTELNCREGFTFPEVYDPEKKTGRLTENKITGVRLRVYYSSWFGDSLNACRMSVYQLNEKLDRNRYTNIEPSKYYRPEGLLGRRAYTAYDTSVTDEERNATDSNGDPTYYPHIDFTLDKDKYGNDWYNRPASDFTDSETFIENVFKGIYLKNDYGDGTILYIDRVDLQMQYEFFVLDDDNVPYKRKEEGHVGEDSIAQTWMTEFASTKEVIQANKFENSKKIEDIVNNEDDCTYIKSPAGIFTEAVLPYDEIYNQLTGDTLNAVSLSFKNYYEKNNGKFSMSPPKYVLLLRKMEFKSFFEENKLPDNVTSFTTEHNSVATNQYTFSNIARLVSTCINEKEAAKKKAKEEADANPEATWDEAQWEKDWSTVYLIPVSITYDESYNGQRTMTNIQNDLQPGYAKLEGGPNKPLKVKVTYTKFHK